MASTITRTTAKTAAATAPQPTRRPAPPMVHLDLDGAWTGGNGSSSLASPFDSLPTVDVRAWGPRLRFSALRSEIEEFYQQVDPLLGSARFVAYGSGDFHHLSALWLRRLLARPAGAAPKRLALISFDNHPDWDIRPPAWCCGSWINRALDLPGVESVSVWGPGSFETWGWHRLAGNRRDTRTGRLTMHPWADARSAAEQARPGSILRGDWREKFSRLAATLAGKDVYATVDLDCLRAGEAVTNWENGFFTVDDVRWALRELRTRGARIVAGDLCGAWSPQGYARWRQCFAAGLDHPKLPDPPDVAAALETNLAAFRAIWPALTGRDEHDADGDEQGAGD